MPFSIGQRFNQCFPIQTTTSKKSYAVIGIIPLAVERRGRKHTATVLAYGMGNERQHGAWQDSVYAR